MSKDLQASVLLALAIVLIALAVLTTLPFPSSHPNSIGYRSLCAFVPMSTLILLGGAGFALAFRSTIASKSRARPDGGSPAKDHPPK